MNDKNDEKNESLHLKETVREEKVIQKMIISINYYFPKSHKYLKKKISNLLKLSLFWNLINYCID